MMTLQRLAEIKRFHELMRVTMKDSPAALPRFQRQIAVGMVDELIAHVEETIRRERAEKFIQQ